MPNINFISAQSIGSSSSVNLVAGNPNVLVFAVQNAATSGTPPTFNGTAFTLSATLGTSGSGVFLFYLIGAADGSHTFVPNGACNVYVFGNVNLPVFTDVVVNDTGDIVNTGVNLVPTVNGGFCFFFQQARSGSGTQVQTAGQGNVLGMQFGATMTHSSPGAGVGYRSTVTYSPAFGPYDQFGIALIPSPSNGLFVTSD